MLLQRGRTKCENLRTNERYEVAQARDVTAFASSRAFRLTSTTNRYTRTGPETLTLIRVAFVPSFIANLVSLDIAISKHFEWDTKNMQLLFYKEHFCFVERNNGHFLLENNINSNHQAFPAVSASTRKVSAEKWHQTLAHANLEVIQHLQANLEGVIVI